MGTTMADTITLDELRGLMGLGAEGGVPRVTVVEVLPPGYWRHTHLPGALNLPPERVEADAPTLLPDRQAPIVLYCWDPT